jgi:hypothetical protein
MPTAVEYAVKPWLGQNGCGSGPPAQSLTHTQNGAGGGPPAQAVVAQPGPVVPPGELLVSSPLTVLLLVVAVLTTVRRQARRPAS